MAKCPDCDRPVPDDAERCPHCRFPLRQFSSVSPTESNGGSKGGSKRQFVYVLLAALILISLSIAVMVWYAEKRLPVLLPEP